MTKLLSAYVALGLPAGSSLADVMRRHRWLACAFHPDRMPEDKKAVAEQEMKRINNARDELCTHYAKCHQLNDEKCYCEPFYASCTPVSSGRDGRNRDSSCNGWAKEPTSCNSGYRGTAQGPETGTRAGGEEPGLSARKGRGEGTPSATDGCDFTAFEKQPAPVPPPDGSCAEIDKWAWRLLWPLLLCLAIMTYFEKLHETAFQEQSVIGIQR